MNNLSGKTALVTGASRGIGRAAALALAKAGRAGARPLRPRQRRKRKPSSTRFRRAGGARRCGVRRPRRARWADEARRAGKAHRGGRLDILVANAGVYENRDASRRPRSRTSTGSSRSTSGRPSSSCSSCFPSSRRTAASSSSPRSLRARRRSAPSPAYAATKGALDTLVKHLASALGTRGIRVNAVAPGVVETDMSSFTRTEAGRDFALSMQALKRLAQPDDIAGTVAFLASAEARWITGDTLRVDGGLKL